MRDLDHVVRDFVALLESTGVPYAIMGGIAVHVHAPPRMTFDFDIALGIDRDALPRIYQEAQVKGFEIPEAQRTGWLDTVKGMPLAKFTCFVDHRPIEVDAYLAETPFLKSVLSRRKKHGYDGFSAWFVSPEDLLLLKVLGNRLKDKADIGDLMLV